MTLEGYTAFVKREFPESAEQRIKDMEKAVAEREKSRQEKEIGSE